MSSWSATNEQRGSGHRDTGREGRDSACITASALARSRRKPTQGEDGRSFTGGRKKNLWNSKVEGSEPNATDKDEAKTTRK